MTFSIVARCQATGQLGVAVASSSPAVAARCAFVRAQVGAVATQNITDPRLGPAVLDMLASGHRPVDVLRILERTEEFLDYRQIALIDAAGNTSFHNGARTLGNHAAVAGTDCVAAGNLLADRFVPARMVTAFAHAEGELADRLLAAMRAALDAGGEVGSVHSAGLLVAEREAWPLTDLRVDWTEGDPVAELVALWQRWRPVMRDYVTRALDPSAAPSFSVTGDP